MGQALAAILHNQYEAEDRCSEAAAPGSHSRTTSRWPPQIRVTHATDVMIAEDCGQVPHALQAPVRASASIAADSVAVHRVQKVTVGVHRPSTPPAWLDGGTHYLVSVLVSAASAIGIVWRSLRWRRYGRRIANPTCGRWTALVGTFAPNRVLGNH